MGSCVVIEVNSNSINYGTYAFNIIGMDITKSRCPVAMNITVSVTDVIRLNLNNINISNSHRYYFSDNKWKVKIEG